MKKPDQTESKSGIPASEAQKIIVEEKKKIESPEKKNPSTNPMPQALKLVTAKDIQMAVASGRGPIMLAPGGIMTPLAKDLAKEYAIKIIKGE